MNKKQLIVAWVMVISIVFVCLNAPTRGVAFDRSIDIVKTLLYIISIIIPAILLIYTLRDKKK